MPQGWTAGPAPTDAWTAGPAPVPTFSSTNEKDASGNAVVAGLSKAWDVANTPFLPQIAEAAHAIAMHLSAPRLGDAELNDKIPGLGTVSATLRGGAAGTLEGAGNLASSFTSPIGLALTLAGLGGEGATARSIPGLKSLLALPAVQKLQKAVQAVSGAGFMAHGGERVINAPDAAGKLQGAAEMASGALGATSALRTGAPRVSEPRLTAPEQASNAFAAERGIPLDAATATGSKFVRGVQKVSGESLLGSPTAERAQQAQAAALTRVGSDLADEAHPSPITSEQAGGNTVASIRNLIGDMNTSANDAYGRLREIEADPKHAQRINTAPEGSSRYNQISAKLAAGSETGQAPHRLELIEMRRIEAELDNLRYQGRTWTFRQAGDPLTGNAAGGHADIVGGSANAPVYQELKGFAPGATGEEMRHAINQTLATGEWNSVSRGAYEIARNRLNKGLTGHDLLPPNTPPLGRDETVNLPVYLEPAKKALAPLRDRLLREKELTGVLMGDKARALVALDALVSGPSHAPISIVDAALGDLKAMGRSDVPELRTQGQGLAAAAVKQLDAQVRATAAKAGPEALQALEEGRAATVAKYQIGQVLGDVAGKGADAEPVSIVRKLTAPNDSAVKLLRRVREVAPGSMSEIARAKLEDMLGKATERGRFDHADRLYADWQKLGAETKQMLFPQPGQRAALDHFFLLAKRIAENPNSSGTAPTLVKTGEAVGLLTHPLATLPPTLSMGAISKLLYSPRGVRALTRFMASAPKAASAGTLRTAAQTAGIAEVVAAARAAGVPMALPQAAGNTTTGAPER